MSFHKLINILFGTGVVQLLTFWGGGGGGGSSSQTTRSELDPTVRPFVKRGLQEAEQLYEAAGPAYYPYQTYVSPSTQTQQALQAAQTRALRGSPLVPQAQQTISGLQKQVNPALSGMQTTASGAYLGSNPYFNAALAGAGQAATRQYLDAIAQGRSGASLAGRYGSGAATELESRAQQNLANALTQRAGELAYQQYGMERGLQESALGSLGSLSEQQAGRQMAAAQAAPGLAAADYQDIQQLMNVGQTAEDYQRQALEADIGRFEYAQNLPYTKLQSFLSAAYGAPMGQVTTAKSSGGK